LRRKNGEFGFRHIEPTAVLWRVMPFEPLDEPSCFICRNVLALLALGFKAACLRQWKHRRAIPDDAKSRLVHFFNDNFEIIDEPKPQLGAGLTLAQQAARYIPWSPNMTNQHSSRELPSQAAIAEKLDV